MERPEQVFNWRRFHSLKFVVADYLVKANYKQSQNVVVSARWNGDGNECSWRVKSVVIFVVVICRGS